MYLPTLLPVFLVLCWCQAVASHVEPPTNVSLRCGNLHNILKWNYGQLSPGLRFRVDYGSDINGAPGVLWVDPPAQLQANVSFLSDPSNTYFLTVTAVIGQNESEPAPKDGIIFSYFKDSPEGQKCFVDFPSVNLTAHWDGTVLLRFEHPWLVYHPKMPSSQNTKPRRKKSHDAQNSLQLPIFHYDVVIINQRHHSSHCVDSVCEEKLSVDAAQKKHCLKFNGELEKMSVPPTREYCVLPLEEEPSYFVHICVVGSLLALSAVAFVLFLVYRKNTTPSTSLPRSMMFTGKLKQWSTGVLQETVCVPEVEPISPTLLLPTEEDEVTPPVTSSTELDFRLPLGVSAEDEGVSDDMEVGNDEEPGYMPGRNMDEDEEVPSGYEKREVLVELAPDELAEGYRG